ncbi:MAG: hypothetical protein IPJ49_29425 [Candidatus Obscuribacter sp.]|nr:hypothetical protein [Candidatus Obscuribacter sp.]
MYGVFRTGGAGQRSFPASSFHAYDWAFCAATLVSVVVQIPEVLMVRPDASCQLSNACSVLDGATSLARLLPLLEMSRRLLKEAKIPRSAGILGTLLALNLNKHIEYTDHFHPDYAKF